MRPRVADNQRVFGRNMNGEQRDKIGLYGSGGSDLATSSSSIRKDLFNILLLMLLYTLQGIPLGLTAALPFILSSRKVGYTDQAIFSLASWPFSLKLLWAPIVDSLFFESIGRRKSWLVPVQYLIGVFMYTFSDYLHEMLEQTVTYSKADIYTLTAIFFMFTFLAATQDIAVDGWGLTILSRENLRWASICNNAGSTFGVLIGNSLFLVLESHEFSNLYIRPLLGLPSQKTGIVTLKEFMQFFGIVFIISTTLVLVLKKETDQSKELDQESLESTLSTRAMFSLLLKIVKLEPVQKLLIVLFTCKIAFATYSIRSLKLIEQGVPKEQLGLLNAQMQMIQLLTPILIGKFLDLNRPLELFLRIYPLRMALTVVLTIWIYFTPSFKTSSNDYPWQYFFYYTILNSVYALVFAAMALVKTAFFTHVSDPQIGGTMMTLFNTISNIGAHWPTTLALFLIDLFSFKACAYYETTVLAKTQSKKAKFLNILKSLSENTCSNDSELKYCSEFGGACVVKIDAFYTITIFCVLVGIVWMYWFRRSIYYLQSVPKTSWRVALDFRFRKRVIEL